MQDNESRGAAYKLMTWLSAWFRSGAFSYSSGIEWAVEAGGSTPAKSCRTGCIRCWLGWLRILRRRLSGAGASRHVVSGCRRPSRYRRARGGICALARAPSGNLGAGTCFHRHRPLRRRSCGGLDLRSPVAMASSIYPRRGWASSAPAHAIPLAFNASCFPSRLNFELDLRRRPAGAARADQRASAVLSARADRGLDWQPRLEASLDDLGSATFRADLASMLHETQYTRLFRS